MLRQALWPDSPESEVCLVRTSARLAELAEQSRCEAGELLQQHVGQPAVCMPVPQAQHCRLWAYSRRVTGSLPASTCQQATTLPPAVATTRSRATRTCTQSKVWTLL